MSCVLISHILGEVLETCDRIVVMRDGKVVAADAVAAISTATKLVAAMGGVESAARRPRDAGATRRAASAPVRVRMRARAADATARARRA